MQRPGIDPTLGKILASPASLGALLDLCEENYQLLLMIAPDIQSMTGSYHSRRAGHLDLHLDILAQSPFTTTLRLTYYFDERHGRAPDPDATLRVYHDAKQLEVLDLRQQALPVGRLFERPGLSRKWKASIFLSKWLWFCVRQGHFFELGDPAVPVEACAAGSL